MTEPLPPVWSYIGPRGNQDTQRVEIARRYDTTREWCEPVDRTDGWWLDQTSPGREYLRCIMAARNTTPRPIVVLFSADELGDDVGSEWAQAFADRERVTLVPIVPWPTSIERDALRQWLARINLVEHARRITARDDGRARYRAENPRGYAGQVPYGYKRDPADKQHFIDDAPIQELIRDAWELRRRGATYPAIGEWWLSRGFGPRVLGSSLRPAVGKAWKPSTVMRILKKHADRYATRVPLPDDAVPFLS